MSRRVPVTFLPSETTAWVSVGTTVLEAARSVGVLIAAPCGERGVCGSCGVRVVDGDLAAADEEEMRGLARAPGGVRLACRARISGPLKVRPVISSTRPVPASLADPARVVVGVDLGTTNVACMVVEADGGRELGSAIVPNRQQSWGADVLSRVSSAQAGHAEVLRAAAEESVLDACRQVIGTASVEGVTIAGNTVMEALLAGVDASSLAAHPFSVPALPRALDASGSIPTAFGGVEVVLVPPLAPFVGGDAFAGLVHTGLLYAQIPSLLIDLGTNAEIVLAAGGRLFATSAAAGPAFEGAGIECGGPGVTGAIVSVAETADSMLEVRTLGEASPLWLSGAGIISAVALLWRRGHLAPDGLLSAEGPLSERFFLGEDDVLRFRIQDRITLSQLDVRAVQLAKAAVRVGIEQVLLAAGLGAADLRAVYVAGSFGEAVAIEDLELLGIVPANTGGPVKSVGNASLLGAVSLALAPEALDDSKSVVPELHHIDLASLEGFSAAMLRALEFGTYGV